MSNSNLPYISKVNFIFYMRWNEKMYKFFYALEIHCMTFPEFLRTEKEQKRGKRNILQVINHKLAAHFPLHSPFHWRWIEMVLLVYIAFQYCKCFVVLETLHFSYASLPYVWLSLTLFAIYIYIVRSWCFNYFRIISHDGFGVYGYNIKLF